MTGDRPMENNDWQADSANYDFKVVDTKQFRLWDFGWFNIISSQISGLSGDSFIPADFFVTLLNHRIYRHGYDGSKHETTDSHGPFLIERLQPSDFVEISSFNQWIEHINTHYADPEFDEPPDKSQIKAVGDYFNKLPKEGMRYFKLAVNHEDEAYHHELWYIHIIFHEYILVNPKKEMMWLTVMGYD